MESNTPSSSAAGAGGKFRKSPLSRKRPSTPYHRPPPTTATNQSNGGGGWLSNLLLNPARRLIATTMLPSFFSKLEYSSADEYESDSSDDEDVDDTVNALSDAKPTLEIGVSSSSRDANVQKDRSVGDLDQIENMLKGKQWTRDESNRLMEILKSRLVDDSNAENKVGLEHEMPHLQSNDEVTASPIDIAKAYMGSQASELGFKTYSNISTDRREHEHNNQFPSKPHIFTPSSKSSTCWPGAMVQDHRNYLTPQTQRSRYGLHTFPRTPYSRTKPKISSNGLSPFVFTVNSMLNQLQGNSRSSNISLTTLQQSRTPNPWQMKTSSDVMNGGNGSVGPIRRNRNKFASEPHSEGPRTFSSAQIPSSSNASRSFVPLFQKKSVTAATPNFHTADKHEQTYTRDVNLAGPSNETVRKILDQLDRHKPTPKQKAAELKLATEWKRSPSQHTDSVMPNLATAVLSENRSFSKGTDGGVTFKNRKETSNAETKILTVNNAGEGSSFVFKNMGAANEKSTVPNFKAKEKSQPWSTDSQVNGQEDFTRKRPSQPILKPISFKRPNPQQVISSDNGPGFTFSFTANASSASEPPTAEESPVIPTYSFGTKKSGEGMVFSFPSAPVDDVASHLKFKFGSDKKRVHFGSIGSDAIVIN